MYAADILYGCPGAHSGGIEIFEIPRRLGFTSKKSMWTFDTNVETQNNSYVKLYLTFGALKLSLPLHYQH